MDNELTYDEFIRMIEARGEKIKSAISPDLRPAVCEQVRHQVDQLARTSLYLDQFAEQVTNLICDKFEFYFVGLFIVDDLRERAILFAGSGEVGPILCARKYPIFLTKTKTLVGTAIKQNAVCIAFSPSYGYLISPLPQNTQLEPILPLQLTDQSLKVRFMNPWLPDQLFEATIPLRTPQEIIGAIQICGRRREDFVQQDIPLFLPLADQIASVCASLIKLGNLRANDSLRE